MKITQGQYAGHRASVTDGLFGNNPCVRVFGVMPHHRRETFRLPSGEMTVRLVNKETRKSGFVVFASVLFFLACVVLFGFFGLLALPVFFAGKRLAVTVELKTEKGKSIAVADKQEWAILSRFLSL